MINSKYLFLHIALLILLLCFSPLSAHNKTNNSTHAPVPSHNSTTTKTSYKGCFSKVYAFGESFTDTGNANLLGGFESIFGGFMSNFYGTTYKLPGQRLCDGRLVIDFLCEKLAIPYLPPYKDTSSNFSFGVNFAIAGSTSLSSNHNFVNHKIHSVGHTGLLWKAVSQSFQTQIDWFNKYLQDIECKGKSESVCKVELENSLFWIGEMGLNDYASTFGSPVSVNWHTKKTVGHVCNILKTLLEKGAKYIVVQGLPPAGCCPLQLSLSVATDRDSKGCSASANAIIKAHNELLQNKLEEFRKLYSHCTIVYADYWNAYNTILENYKNYQFEEPFKACCGAGGGALNFNLHSVCGSLGTSACKNPGQYINWDGVHLTEAMHGKLIDLFLNHGYCKPSFDQMIKIKGCV